MATEYQHNIPLSSSFQRGTSRQGGQVPSSMLLQCPVQMLGPLDLVPVSAWLPYPMSVLLLFCFITTTLFVLFYLGYVTYLVKLVRYLT